MRCLLIMFPLTGPSPHGAHPHGAHEVLSRINRVALSLAAVGATDILACEMARRSDPECCGPVMHSRGLGTARARALAHHPCGGAGNLTAAPRTEQNPGQSCLDARPARARRRVCRVPRREIGALASSEHHPLTGVIHFQNTPPVTETRIP